MLQKKNPRKSPHYRTRTKSRHHAPRGSSRPGTVQGAQRTYHIEDEKDAEGDTRSVLLTRRHFLYGAAGVAAVAVVGGGGYALSRASSSGRASSSDTLEVSSEHVFTTDECSELDEESEPLTLVSTEILDYGTLIWASDDDIAACLIPTDTSNPLTNVAILSLADGTSTTILENAVGQDEGFEIYDVRACSHGVVWAEANIFKGIWRVYHAPLNGTSLGTIVLGAQGDSNWEMPTLVALQDYAFWQVVPRIDGTATQEDSGLYRAAFGQDEADQVYVSHGRMACAPCAADDGIVITPRADISGTYYQLTRIDPSTAQVTDVLMLPSAMKPLEATFGDTGFAFAFDAIYDYGDGIANLGTYTATTMPDMTDADSLSAAAAAYGNVSWFRYPRTPLTAPAWCGNWFIVKSTSAVCGVDLDTREYFALEVEEGADDYGDYLASTGTRSRIVTYSNIDYTTVDNDQVKHCLVRVWEPSV